MKIVYDTWYKYKASLDDVQSSRTITLFPFFTELRPLLVIRKELFPLYNFKTAKDIFMKLGTNIKHHQTMCRAQESLLYSQF